MYLHVRFWEDVHKYYLKVHISYLRAENGKGDTNISFIHIFSKIKKPSCIAFNFRERADEIKPKLKDIC